MAANLSKLKEYRSLLEEAYYTGILEVSFDGEVNKWQSAKDLRRALSDLTAKINQIEGRTGRPVAASIDLGGF